MSVERPLSTDTPNETLLNTEKKRLMTIILHGEMPMDTHDILFLRELLLVVHIIWVWLFIGHSFTKRQWASWFIMVTGIIPGILLFLGTLFVDFVIPWSSLLEFGTLLLWGILRKNLSCDATK